jgi:lactoylglutathione lyase
VETGNVKHIATVAVYVEDQDAALQIWIGKIGFKVIAINRWDPRKDGSNGPENVQIRLVLYPKSMMPNGKELKPSIVFGCEDVRGTYDRLSSNGVKFLDEPKKMAWGTSVQFEDPDGNRFLLKG